MTEPTCCNFPGCYALTASAEGSYCKWQRASALDERYLRSRHAAIPVTAVCGSPGSGKSSWVRKRAVRGDVIVDFDDLFMAVSGRALYDKPDCLFPFVAEARDAITARLLRPSDAGHAYIISGGANADYREKLVRELGCDVVVLEVPEAECIRRIAADQRRASCVQLWPPLVRRWWREYSRRPGDVIDAG